ncbi:MAG: [FeFe] hydrogenase H-cluster radical SAM maturase HydE [Rikenellaceae bacterium]
MLTTINKLKNNRSLSSEEYRQILLSSDRELFLSLQKEARDVALENFGNRIYIRGLIEISNHCRNNCYYCGIRAANRDIERYRLDIKTILECCRSGYELGFRTFVLQGGEDRAQSDDWMVECTRKIRNEFKDCAITLSIGEKTKEVYQRFYDAGANRYLLRHETICSDHYSKLHPKNMNIESRIEALESLKEVGFQVGTGIMVGSPYQTINNIVEDIKFIENFKPQMIGIGPFIPHKSTPFATDKSADIELTLKLLSIFRLISPKALIPSTTALSSLAEDGRERGILSGANVVMPNLSPSEQRSKYSLYNNKAAFGVEAAEGLRKLEQRFEAIGYTISYERGDFFNYKL